MFYYNSIFIYISHFTTSSVRWSSRKLLYLLHGYSSMMCWIYCLSAPQSQRCESTHAQRYLNCIIIWLYSCWMKLSINISEFYGAYTLIIYYTLWLIGHDNCVRLNSDLATQRQHSLVASLGLSRSGICLTRCNVFCESKRMAKNRFTFTLIRQIRIMYQL